MQKARVIAVVATYRRPRELSRLLDTLERQDGCVAGAVIADNAADAFLPEAARFGGRTFPVAYVSVPDNPGCGAGLALAEREAENRFAGEFTHFLILDDDAVLADGTVGRLLDCAARHGLDLIAPLVRSADGSVWAHPEPRVPELRRAIRKAGTPAEALDLLGPGPHAMAWCAGVCQLVSADLVKRMGVHRSDMWMLGEDLEFSMRAAGSGKCGFVCDTVVEHLPPASGKTTERALAAKFGALLQNLTFLALRSGMTSHLWRYLPGNYRRFFATFGISLDSVRVTWSCFLAGGIHGEAAGGPHGAALRRAIQTSMFSEKEL